MIKENFIGYIYLGDRESSQKPPTAGMVAFRLEVYTTSRTYATNPPPDHNNQGTTFPVVVYHC
ncbi:MAG: hypothetical protein ACE1S7_06275 [Candidatus Tisiphia sp.]